MKFSAEHLAKSYQARAVLTDVTLSVQAGERLVIMGPSGCGKTTLCRILAGLEKADHGILRGFQNARVSMVFQEDRLCAQLSAVENAALPLLKKQARSLASDALTQLGLHVPEQTKPVAQLSGGQKRRVALARALLASSDLLLLDEPFRGLDSETRARAIGFVLNNQGRRALICVTHEPAETEALRAPCLTLSAPLSVT